MVIMISDHGARPARRLDGEAVQRQADAGRHDDGDQHGERQRDAGLRREHRRHAAEHDELALGEIDDVGGVVDQREAERDQRIDGANRQPRENKLQQLGHRGEGLSGSRSITAGGTDRLWRACPLTRSV